MALMAAWLSNSGAASSVFATLAWVGRFFFFGAASALAATAAMQASTPIETH